MCSSFICIRGPRVLYLKCIHLRIEQGGLGVKRDALFDEFKIYYIKDESSI